MSAFPRFEFFKAISALAGSGKTYQLACRYIALLAMNFKPERIQAITFTRAAAGEIFDRVVRRLAEAAASEDKRTELERDVRRQLGQPEDDGIPVTTADVRNWLKALIEAMPRLRIGTIDSLFVSILKAYAVELGLPARQEMLEGARLTRAQEEALAEAFRSVGLDPKTRPAYWHAFLLATAGESKNIRGAVLGVIEKGYDLYQDHPEEGAWGAQDRMWSGTEAWWTDARPADHRTTRDMIGGFESGYLQRGGLPPKYVEAWERILRAAKARDWDAAMTNTLPQALLEACRKTDRGPIQLSYNRKEYVLSGEDAERARHIVKAILRGAIERSLEEVRGMHRLLAAYDRGYQEEVRRRGRLSFSDVPLLLGRMCEPGRKLDIEYRLDGQIDHWLMDEFQDTSGRQWEVIRGLANEVLSSQQDRSFFYVGDVKQAIYAWRGGESTLFEKVLNDYQPLFHKGDLTTSWRSSPVVLDAVNRAFGKIRNVQCLNEYPKTVGNWDHYWKNHVVASRNAGLPGRVELWEVAAEGGQRKIDPRIRQVCTLVRSLVDQGVQKIGVLVRLNNFGDLVADALRREKLPVRREANPELMDNAVISALLSLLTLAEHPGDRFAARHVRYSPLWTALEAWAGNAGEIPRLAARLRDTAAREGVAGLLEQIVEACRTAGIMDGGFIATRVSQLLDAAAEFDRTGDGGLEDFARLARSLSVSDPSVEGHVVVMTVHKAKGLEFDAVVLPDLQGARRQWSDAGTGDLKEGTSEDRNSDESWIFPVPKEPWASADEILNRFAHRVEDLHVSEELCLLYVAMTRARQGLYLVMDPPPEKGTALFAATFLRETLAGNPEAKGTTRLLYEQGEADWPQKTQEKKPSDAIIPKMAPEAFHPAAAVAASGHHRLNYITPSGEERLDPPRPAHLLFLSGKKDAAERGTALHDLFSRIEWLTDQAGAQALAAHEKEKGPCPEAVREEFMKALASAAVKTALGRPSKTAEAWREQAFEFAGPDTWISGRMDRVVIERDAAGQPVAAMIVDFKSDRVGSDAEIEAMKARYEPQIARYQQVLSSLLGLPENQIRAQLILTRTGQVVEYP